MREFQHQAAAIAASGRWEKVNVAIRTWCEAPIPSDQRWWGQLLTGLCSRIFYEYLALKRANEQRNASNEALLAWRARNLLELSVWAHFCIKKDDARRFFDDAGKDTNEIISAFEKWGKSMNSEPTWFEPARHARSELRERALGRGVSSIDGTYIKVSRAADEIGIKDHFDVSWKLLSKFAHPTAMTILAPQDESKAMHRCDLLFERDVYSSSVLSRSLRAFSLALTGRRCPKNEGDLRAVEGRDAAIHLVLIK